jgi:hypothetical protein
MSDFARRRQVARVAVGVLALGLTALMVIEDESTQILLTVVVITALLVQRGSWRCPQCGLPPSALPWGAPPACRRCDASLR